MCRVSSSSSRIGDAPSWQLACVELSGPMPRADATRQQMADRTQQNESSPSPVPITSIWSWHDSMVIPQASSELACANNVVVIGIGHNALLANAGVTAQVIQKLDVVPRV